MVAVCPTLCPPLRSEEGCVSLLSLDNDDRVPWIPRSIFSPSPPCVTNLSEKIWKKESLSKVFSREKLEIWLSIFNVFAISYFRTIDFSKRSVHLRKKKKKKKKKVFSKTIFTLESTRALKKGVRNPLREVSKSHCRSRRSIHLPKNRESDDSRNFYSQIYSHPEGIPLGCVEGSLLKEPFKKIIATFDATSTRRKYSRERASLSKSLREIRPGKLSRIGSRNSFTSLRRRRECQKYPREEGLSSNFTPSYFTTISNRRSLHSLSLSLSSFIQYQVEQE